MRWEVIPKSREAEILTSVGSSCLKYTFAVDINSGKLVSHLKEVIKENQKPFSDSIPTKDIKLWKAEIPDDRDDTRTVQKPLAAKMISNYFEEHIHVEEFNTKESHACYG
ncbi:hypothetical protein GLOIN_2v811958 [Rhizophagus clarus]|uniref:Crinkler effector protein N-terminal domain-containing protein n=1 Tax=Rhizophagus clarus TaxID=94130 RepID=A0A8H3MAM1_9GLOM|nr:hypothetical protein GLOIN_2v811958 [Rhizophagus clarus]